MPGGLNGLDLARWVRDVRNGMPPAILATGYSDQAQSAADEGFTILRKPYDTATLHDALSDTLRRSRHREVA
jgi:two-component system NtrC family sensor kinase